jgi:2-polyprenyl-6-methoxyphenol hydroxylase-like FAD-dependent oxidoreductase
MMQTSEPRALIVGGGIGGLTAAIALKQSGMQVCVLEKTKRLRPIGAGITLQMNAMAALDHLGLCDAIRDAGNVIDSIQVQNAEGNPFSEVPIQRLSDETGFPFVAIHRGRLQEVLLNALGREHLIADADVKQIEAKNGRVRAWLQDDRSEVGDLLIGADGIHSTVREFLWGAQPKRYTGYAAWRGVCANPSASSQSEFVEVWGNQQVFGSVPINAEQTYWFATKRTPAGDKTCGDPRAEIHRRLDQLPAHVHAMIESTPPEQILFNDIYDRPPISQWGRGRITLLGDAAHPMTPNMGQGGGQAIEDGVVLANSLAAESEIEAGLRSYESRRYDRTKQFVDHSRMMTCIAHGHPLWARTARATVFRWMPEFFKVRQMRGLYRFQI